MLEWAVDHDHLIHREHDDEVGSRFHVHISRTVDSHHDDVGDERDAGATDADGNGILLSLEEHQL